MRGPGVKIVVNGALFALLFFVSCGFMFWWLGGGGDNPRYDGFARAWTIKFAPMFATMVVAIMGADAGLASAYRYPKNVFIFGIMATLIGSGFAALLMLVDSGFVTVFSIQGFRHAIPYVAPFFVVVCAVLAIRLARTAIAQRRAQQQLQSL